MKPDHITNDGEEINRGDSRHLNFGSISPEYLLNLFKRLDELKKLSGYGIIPYAHLEGIQTKMCANLGNPTTIVEFSPDGEPVRTDSKLLFYSMHEPCRIFREITHECLCIRCDGCISILFYGLDKQNLSTEIRKRIAKDTLISNYINQGGYFRFHEEGERPYLEYDCLMLGYRELAFPVFVDEKAIAVFLVLQLCLESNLGKIAKHQRRYFKSIPQPFDCRITSEAEWRELGKRVNNAHKKWIRDATHILNDPDYRLFIDITINEIKDLEITLCNELLRQRDAYFRKNAEQLVADFNSKMNTTVSTGKEKWECLWNNAATIFKELIKRFNILYIVVFASKRFEQKEIVLDAVVAEGQIPDKIRLAIENRTIGINLSNIPNNLRNQWTSSGDDPMGTSNNLSFGVA
jgi:hypothetical protein